MEYFTKIYGTNRYWVVPKIYCRVVGDMVTGNGTSYKDSLGYLEQVEDDMAFFRVKMHGNKTTHKMVCLPGKYLLDCMDPLNILDDFNFERIAKSFGKR